MNARLSQPTNLLPCTGPEGLQNLRTLAMFLMELGVQVSAEVINRLTPEEHRQIAHAIADLELTDPNSNETSFDFQSMKAKGEAVANLESDYALHLVREALRAESPSQTADAGWPEENLAYFTSSAASEVG